MNKFIFILLVICLLSQHIFGQCTNGVSTNPNNPSNNNLPYNKFGQMDEFLNQWNWWSGSAASSILLNDMGMNVGQYYGVMEPVNSTLYSGHYLYLNKLYREVMKPEEGWELLSVNIGWYPDHSTPINYTLNPALRKLPYIIFYNKYSGVLRVFCRYGNNETPIGTINAVELSLAILSSDDNNANGILRLGQGKDIALDKATNVLKATSYAPAPGGAELWFSADFLMAFDPCVCFYKSDIQLTAAFKTTADITLYGRSIELPENLFSGSNLINSDFLGSFDLNANSENNGYISYKSINNMIQDFNSKIEAYETKLTQTNDYNLSVKKARAMLDVAFGIMNVGAGQPGAEGMIKGFDFSKTFSIFMDLMGLDPFAQKTKPTKPSMPVVSYSEMRFEGNSTFQTEIAGPTISTPGSLNSNLIDIDKPSRYPVYDEALGIFALLESPKIKVSQTSVEECGIERYQTITLTQGSHGEGDYDVPLYRTLRREKTQIQLAEDLKYYFNPSLNIKDYEIEVGFLIKSENTVNGSLPTPAPSAGIVDFLSNTRFYSNPTGNVNISSLDIKTHVPQEVNYSESFNIQGAYLPINAFKAATFGFGYDYIFRHPGVPFELTAAQLEMYLRDSLANCTSLKNQLNKIVLEKKYYLKIAMHIVFDEKNSSNENNMQEFIFTYEIDPENIQMEYYDDLVPNLKGSAGDVSGTTNLYMYSPNFDGSYVDGCDLLENDTYVCSSWKDIFITGNVQISNGYTVNIEAGNSIYVDGETNIPNEMILQIVPKMNFSHPMPVMDADFVNEFCLYKYLANRPEVTPAENSHKNDSSIVNKTKNFDFNVFPNPTNDIVDITFNSLYSHDVLIEIADLRGIVINKINLTNLRENTSPSYRLDFSKLSTGTYIVTMIVNGERKSKKVIKL